MLGSAGHSDEGSYILCSQCLFNAISKAINTIISPDVCYFSLDSLYLTACSNNVCLYGSSSKCYIRPDFHCFFLITQILSVCVVLCSSCCLCAMVNCHSKVNKAFCGLFSMFGHVVGRVAVYSLCSKILI